MRRGRKTSIQIILCPPSPPHLPHQETVIWELWKEEGEAASILSFV